MGRSPSNLGFNPGGLGSAQVNAGDDAEDPDTQLAILQEQVEAVDALTDTADTGALTAIAINEAGDDINVATSLLSQTADALDQSASTGAETAIAINEAGDGINVATSLLSQTTDTLSGATDTLSEVSTVLASVADTNEQTASASEAAAASLADSALSQSEITNASEAAAAALAGSAISEGSIAAAAAAAAASLAGSALSQEEITEASNAAAASAAESLTALRAGAQSDRDAAATAALAQVNLAGGAATLYDSAGNIVASTAAGVAGFNGVLTMIRELDGKIRLVDNSGRTIAIPPSTTIGVTPPSAPAPGAPVTTPRGPVTPPVTVAPPVTVTPPVTVAPPPPVTVAPPPPAVRYPYHIDNRDGTVTEHYSATSKKRWWIAEGRAEKDMKDGSVWEVYADQHGDVKDAFGSSSRWWISNPKKGQRWRGTDSAGNRLAKGGITTGPTTALIGEAGQEAIIPLKELPGIVRTLSQSETNGQLGGFFSGRSTQAGQVFATGSTEYGLDSGQAIAPRRGGSAGGDIIINTTINLQGADFSDPNFINRLSRQVGDAIVEKVRIAGSGRVA